MATTLNMEPRWTRGIYRVCVEVAKRKEKLTFIELGNLMAREMDADDANEDVPGDAYFCPECKWIGAGDEASVSVLKHATRETPAEHDDPRCPKCGAYLEDAT